LASWFVEAAVAEPLAAPRRRARAKSRAATKRRSRARGGVFWIAVSGVLLVGVVFVNVAVLRLNLQLDKSTQQRSKLRGENAALQSELSSRLASPRIQSLARREYGLVPADESAIGYVNLGR
jgi:cell division protein FtsL